LIEYTLTQAHRLTLAQAFHAVPRVDLSIECILEGQMGRAFADDAARLTAFKIAVGPFVYFAGEAASAGSRELIESTPPWTLIMPSGPGWLEAVQSMYGERLLAMERHSFSSEHLSLAHLDHVCQAVLAKATIKRIDLDAFKRLQGPDGFFDISEFDSAQDFLERGIGFYAETSRLAGVAYSSLVCSKGIEVSIFVVERYRRQGIAAALACHLLRWCLLNGLDPHWDAANLPSCHLAEKLGYTATGTYRAYYVQGGYEK